MAKKHTETNDPLNALWERQRVSAVPWGPPKQWGYYANAILAGLQNKVVSLGMHDGSCITGALVGYSQHWYTLTIKGDAVLVNKGAVDTLGVAA